MVALSSHNAVHFEAYPGFSTAPSSKPPTSRATKLIADWLFHFSFQLSPSFWPFFESELRTHRLFPRFSSIHPSTTLNPTPTLWSLTLQLHPHIPHPSSPLLIFLIPISLHLQHPLMKASVHHLSSPPSIIYNKKFQIYIFINMVFVSEMNIQCGPESYVTSYLSRSKMLFDAQLRAGIPPLATEVNRCNKPKSVQPH